MFLKDDVIRKKKTLKRLVVVGYDSDNYFLLEEDAPKKTAPEAVPKAEVKQNYEVAPPPKVGDFSNQTEAARQRNIERRKEAITRPKMSEAEAVRAGVLHSRHRVVHDVRLLEARNARGQEALKSLLRPRGASSKVTVEAPKETVEVLEELTTARTIFRLPLPEDLDFGANRPDRLVYKATLLEVHKDYYSRLQKSLNEIFHRITDGHLLYGEWMLKLPAIPTKNNVRIVIVKRERRGLVEFINSTQVSHRIVSMSLIDCGYYWRLIGEIHTCGPKAEELKRGSVSGSPLYTRARVLGAPGRFSIIAWDITDSPIEDYLPFKSGAL